MAEERNRSLFGDVLYANVPYFQARRDSVSRENETEWVNGDLELPAAAERDEPEMDLQFDSNALAAQLEEICNDSLRKKKKNTNAPVLRLVGPPSPPHNPTRLAEGKRAFEKASMSFK